MSIAKIEKGWVVQLKSGGPLMTVTEVDSDEDGKVYCQWFGDKNKLEFSSFAPFALTIIDQS
ncbi:DUF2158 domain-containing protein [Rhizobium leguminosarum]|uniref:DUF2158 domain-containing protein n=1 Tax=Rhizobium leguminosarum TaxID=384 RepID=A0AAJ1AA32_RHILE|nr:MULTISPECIES: DUF2158 domain-containing protein [Rhizobium]MBY3306160.1 DUF2158 domain-containing protein [Rhizobium laguerreae]MBY5630424.1 DUF2158 domain-containing protein [Rhizobium leguminosarum]